MVNKLATPPLRPKLRPRTKTDEKTLRGRSVFVDETGDITGAKGTRYSEVTTTIPWGTEWITAPTIDKDGSKLSDEEVARRLKDNEGRDFITGEKLPTFESEPEASAYAEWRSDTMFDEEQIEKGYKPVLEQQQYEEDVEETLSDKVMRKSKPFTDEVKGFLKYLMTPSQHFDEGGLATQTETAFGYTAKGVQQEADKYAEEFNEQDQANITKAAEFLVPFYDSGVNIGNVVQEYMKPEAERDNEYIKDQFKQAGQSAAIEGGLLLMGGILTKYGAKGVKALADKVKQYEIDPNVASAFGVGAIRKKDTFEEVMTPVKSSKSGVKKSGDAILRPSADLASDLDPRLSRAMSSETAGSIMPGPGKFFDPSKKGYKGDKMVGMLKGADIELDLEFGNYIMMGKGAPKDVSNETFENLFVSARPSQKRTTFGKNNKSVARANLYDGPSLTVADMKKNYKAATGKTGPEVRTNLLQPERFKVVTDEGDRLLDHPIVAVETKGKGGKHFYTLDTQFVGPVRMDRITQKVKRKNPKTGEVREEVPQPNLRPATVGDVKLGEQVGTIRVGKKDHPLYDYIEVDASMSAPEGMGSIAKFNQGGMAMKDDMNMGYALGGEVDAIDPVSGNEIPPGSTAKEVRDDIPTMLSEGEYVVPADVLKFYGLKFFEDLRANAKVEMAMMEEEGRIGGQPVPEEGELTEDEMTLLGEVMGMAEGGMNQMQPQPPQPMMMGQQMMPPKPQPTQFNKPVGFDEGGMTDAFGNPIGAQPVQTQPPQQQQFLQDIDPTSTNIYGLDRQQGDQVTSISQEDIGVGETQGASGVSGGGMKTVFYIHKDGRRISVLMLNGKPISSVPADFNEFMEDTPENRTKIGMGETGEVEVGVGEGTQQKVTTEGSSGSEDPNESVEVYKASAKKKPDASTPEGAYQLYEESGVNVQDPVGQAKKILEGTTDVPKGAGILAGAISPIAGIGLGGFQAVDNLTAVSKAQANKQMAEFLGMESEAAAIQTEIDKFVKSAPGIVGALDEYVASGDQRFGKALESAFSVNAPDEMVIYEDKLSDKGKANVAEYLSQFKKTDPTQGTSLRPRARPANLGEAKPEITRRREVKGKYDVLSNKKLSGGYNTNTLSAAEQKSFDQAVDNGTWQIANHFAMVNRHRNKQDEFAKSGYDPVLGRSLGLNQSSMDQAKKYGGSVQTAINEGRAKKVGFFKPVEVIKKPTVSTPTETRVTTRGDDKKITPPKPVSSPTRTTSSTAAANAAAAASRRRDDRDQSISRAPPKPKPKPKPKKKSVGTFRKTSSGYVGGFDKGGLMGKVNNGK